jgi:hypothetical protein
MFIFPTSSVGVELLFNRYTSSLIKIIGKWLIFWAVGIRLFTTGLRQIIKPKLISEGILGIKGRGVWQLVRELDLANISIYFYHYLLQLR